MDFLVLNRIVLAESAPGLDLLWRAARRYLGAYLGDGFSSELLLQVGGLLFCGLLFNRAIELYRVKPLNICQDRLGTKPYVG